MKEPTTINVETPLRTLAHTGINADFFKQLVCATHVPIHKLQAGKVSFPVHYAQTGFLCICEAATVLLGEGGEVHGIPFHGKRVWGDEPPFGLVCYLRKLCFRPTMHKLQVDLVVEQEAFFVCFHGVHLFTILVPSFLRMGKAAFFHGNPCV